MATAGGALGISPGEGQEGVVERGPGSLLAQVFSSSLYTLEPSVSGGFRGSRFAVRGDFVAVRISYCGELIWGPALCCIS